MDVERAPHNEALNVATGLLIFANYGFDHVSAEHDVIYAGPTDGERIVEADRLALLARGWEIEADSNRWVYYT